MKRQKGKKTTHYLNHRNSVVQKQGNNKTVRTGPKSYKLFPYCISEKKTLSVVLVIVSCMVKMSFENLFLEKSYTTQRKMSLRNSPVGPRRNDGVQKHIKTRYF